MSATDSHQPGGYRDAVPGDVVEAGDVVQCMVDNYASIRRGELRQVKEVIDYGHNYVMRNGHSPRGTSPYRSDNFRLIRKYVHPKPQETKMNGVVFMAARLPQHEHYGTSLEELARELDGGANVMAMMADTSYNVLKRKVEARIKANPDEKWLMFSGNTVAEMSAPPITFRSA